MAESPRKLMAERAEVVELGSLEAREQAHRADGLARRARWRNRASNEAHDLRRDRPTLASSFSLQRGEEHGIDAHGDYGGSGHVIHL